MADQANQILNNRPPNVTDDFGIVDQEDKLDRTYMPDESENREPHTGKEQEKRR